MLRRLFTLLLAATLALGPVGLEASSEDVTLAHHGSIAAGFGDPNRDGHGGEGSTGHPASQHCLHVSCTPSYSVGDFTKLSRSDVFPELGTIENDRSVWSVILDRDPPIPRLSV